MKLSVIIPAYNSKKYIKRTLQSLLGQTLKKFEVIVVDDGSTDGTYATANGMLKNSGISEYKVVRKENGGVSSARNRGLDSCTGDYVIFLDSDDYVSGNLIERVYECLERKKYDIISWGFNKVADDESPITNYFIDYKKIDHEITGIEALQRQLSDKSMWIWTGSAAYKKVLLKKYGLQFTNGCSSGEDLEFIYRALSVAEDVWFINEILSYYVQREGSLSNAYNIKKLQAVYAFKRASLYMAQSPNHELKRISRVLAHEKTIGVYFNFIQSAFKIGKVKDIGRLFKQIDDVFPGLNEEMVRIMRNYNGANRKLFIKIKLFLASPSLYSQVFRFKNRALD